MEIQQDAPVGELTIKGVSLKFSLPFYDGYRLRQNDADVLNQTYRENLSNNFRKVVEEAIEKGNADPQALQKELDEYVISYDFGVRVGGFKSADPIETQAITLAKMLAKKALRQQGVKTKDIDNERLASVAREILEKNPSLRARAETIVKAKNAAAKDFMKSTVA